VRCPVMGGTPYGSRSPWFSPHDAVRLILSLSKDEPNSKRRKRRPASSPLSSGLNPKTVAKWRKRTTTADGASPIPHIPGPHS